MSISLLSEKEGNQDEIERSFERWREQEERWRVTRREREEKEIIEERDCDNSKETKFIIFWSPGDIVHAREYKLTNENGFLRRLPNLQA